jgi:hypothetical protein
MRRPAEDQGIERRQAGHAGDVVDKAKARSDRLRAFMVELSGVEPLTS